LKSFIDSNPDRRLDRPSFQHRANVASKTQRSRAAFVPHICAETGPIEWHSTFEAHCRRHRRDFMTAHAFPADPTLEALRVQRDAYAAAEGHRRT
jgi:hypothetical protein